MADKENFSVVTWLSLNTAKSCDENEFIDLVDILHKINMPDIAKKMWDAAFCNFMET